MYSKSQSGSLERASKLCFFPRDLQTVVHARIGTIVHLQQWINEHVTRASNSSGLLTESELSAADKITNLMTLRFQQVGSATAANDT